MGEHTTATNAHSREFADIARVCELLGVRPRTVQGWRKTRGFPEPMSLGHRTKRWDLDEVRAWARAQREPEE